MISLKSDTAKGKKVDANQEMIAIGMSNIMGSFASSFPVTGSFCRSSVNAASGVRTPFGGLYTGILNVYNEGKYTVGNQNGFYSAASLVLLAITVLTPYFFFIPKSCLAAVIICSIIFMVEVHLVKLVWKSKSKYFEKIFFWHFFFQV
jgi:sodium-independent sulfate anion transporter 11